jgi:hypothetical protein
MSRPRARPRFTIEVPSTPEQIGARVQALLADPASAVEGSVFRRTLLLTVRPEARHFWSPHLDVQLEALPGGGTRVSALFAPHPQIWTSFVAVQAIFGLLSVGAAIWLTSMLTLGRDPRLALGVLGVMLFGGGFAYGAAYVGQGLGSEQMYQLRAFLDGALSSRTAPTG